MLKARKFDANGDGKPETVAELVSQFKKFKPVLAARLRQGLGDGAVILANTGGPQTSKILNGVTVEMEHCSTGAKLEQCIAFLEAQHKVSVLPAMSVMWLTGESAANPAAAQCKRVAEIQAKLPYVMAGTDFYDGSHVTCNPTV